MAGTKFWKKFVLVQIGDTEINGDQLEVQFKIKSAPEKPDELELVIYNLSDGSVDPKKDTKAKLIPDVLIKLTAGYADYYGVVHIGKLWQWNDEYDGADVKTTITSLSVLTGLDRKCINLNYVKGTRKIDAAKDMLKAAVLTFSEIDDDCDITYTSPKVFTNTKSLKQNLTEIATEIGYILLERKGALVFIRKNSGTTTGFELNVDSGLISVRKVVIKKEIPEPVKVEEPGFFDKVMSYLPSMGGRSTATPTDTESSAERDFEVTCLFNHELSIGAIIDLKSNISKGIKRCRIEEMDMSSSGSEHVCNLQLKIIAAQKNVVPITPA